MVEDEYVAVPVLELLTNCVAAKMNFVFCGEPGAGKTECAKFFRSLFRQESVSLQ